MGRICKLLLGLVLILGVSSLYAQSEAPVAPQTQDQEGAAQVWNRVEQSTAIPKKGKKKYARAHKKKVKRTRSQHKKYITKAPRSKKRKRWFKKHSRHFRPLGKRLRNSKAYEWPPWLIDLNLMLTLLFIGIFFALVVGLYFLLLPQILLSFYQLLLLAASFSGFLFWYVILGTEQGFDMAIWKIFFKHGWLAFPLLFGIYFGFRLLFKSPMMIPFLQLLLIGFLIGIVFYLLSLVINY